MSETRWNAWAALQCSLVPAVRVCLLAVLVCTSVFLQVVMLSQVAPQQGLTLTVVQTRNWWINRPMSKAPRFFIPRLRRFLLKSFDVFSWLLTRVPGVRKTRAKLCGASGHSYFERWVSELRKELPVYAEFTVWARSFIPIRCCCRLLDRDRKWSTCCCLKQQGKQFGQNSAASVGASPRS